MKAPDAKLLNEDWDPKGGDVPMTFTGLEEAATLQVTPPDRSGFLGALGVPLACFSGDRTVKI